MRPPGDAQPDTSADDLLQVVAELDRTDPDWRLEQIEAKRKVIPDEKNGAKQIGKVVALLRSVRWSSLELSERVHTLPAVQLSGQEEALLRANLDKVSDARSEARKMLAFPEGRLRVVWGRTGMDIILDEQQATRNVAELLLWDAALRAQEGDVNGAVGSCRCILHCGRVIGDEPILTSQLVRTALAGIAVITTERVLAQGEADETVLAALQAAVADESEHPRQRIAVRGERGGLHWTLSAMEAGDFTPAVFAQAMPPEQRKVVEQWPTGPALRPAHAQALREMTRWLEITGRLLPEQPRLVEEWERSQVTSAGGLLRLHPASRLTDSCLRVQAVLDSALAAVAVERYRRAHGDWPAGLRSLVPAYLKEVPKDPYDGAPLRYRRVADGVVVYSVGPDRADNQGALVRGVKPADDTDISFQLWDVTRRGQPPGAGRK
jgi:hypothetical protein